MNLSKFLFKFVIICTYILRVGLLILPIAIVGVLTKEGGWKYGFTFIQNNMSVALFISFAIAFLISLYHAISFEEIEGAPDENFMKSTQVVEVAGDTDLNAVSDFLDKHTKYKDISKTDGMLNARRKVHFLSADKLEVHKNANLFTIKSSPFASWWFIDFGRNYKNVKEIATFIKLGK
jgi:hypothetical protein